MTLPASVTYTGSALMPGVTVKDSSHALTAGTDYVLSWADNTNAGTAAVTVKAKADGNYSFADVPKSFTIDPKPLSESMLSGIDEVYYFKWYGLTPEPVLTDGKLTLALDTDYTVSYENNVDAHAATGEDAPKLTVTGKGNYTGSITKNFAIEYTAPPTDYLQGILGGDGWYRSEVMIAADGWKVGTSNHFDPTLTCSEEGIHQLTVYFLNTTTWYVTAGQKVTVKIDKMAPTGKITLGNKWWEGFLNAISFHHYSLSTKTVTIDLEDELSGAGQIDYAIVSGQEQYETAEEVAKASLSWQMYDAGNKPVVDTMDEELVIYARLADAAGNVSYIRSDGILLDTKAPMISEVSIPTERGKLEDTTAFVSFRLDEAADYYYVALPAGQTAPSAEDIISTCDAQAVGAEGGSVITQAAAHGTGYASDISKAIERKLTGLMANTTYRIYLTAVDRVIKLDSADAKELIGNVGQVAASEAFTTLKTVPTVVSAPSLSGVYGDKLSEMIIDKEGTARVAADGEAVQGTWKLTDADAGDMPAVASAKKYELTFVPDASYNGRFETAILSVLPKVARKEITVAVDAKSRRYGEENPKLTYTVSQNDLVCGDDESALGITLSCEADVSSDTGSYAIEAETDSDNYAVTVNAGVLTITRAEGSISVSESSIEKTYGDESFVVNYTSKGDGSVRFAVTDSKNAAGETVSDNSILTVSGNGIVSVGGAGEARIKVQLSAGRNYTSAEETITVLVAKAQNAPGMPDAALTVNYTLDQVGKIALPKDWQWDAPDREKELAVSGTMTATAVYCGADKGNYENESVLIRITRQPCTHPKEQRELRSGKEADCEHEGYTGDLYCLDCEEILEAGSAISKAAHNWGGYQQTTAPECTKAGEEERECSACHQKEKREIAAAGHDYSDEWTIDVEPTETEPGSKSHHCMVCGDKKDITVIPSTNAGSGEDDKKPGEDDKKPGEGTQNPNTDDKKPGEGTQKPNTDDKKPGESTQKPVDHKTPVEAQDGSKVITFKNGEASITGLKKSTAKTITIPQTVKVDGVKYQVTKIEAYAFQNASKAATVTLPKTVVKIKAYAFAKSKLKTVKITIPKGAKLSVDKKAFAKSKVKKLQLTMSKKSTKKQRNAAIKAFTKAKIKKKNIKLKLK